MFDRVFFQSAVLGIFESSFLAFDSIKPDTIVGYPGLISENISEKYSSALVMNNSVIAGVVVRGIPFMSLKNFRYLKGLTSQLTKGSFFRWLENLVVGNQL